MVKKGEIFLELVDSNSKIKKDLLKALATEANKVLASNVRRIEKEIKLAVARWVSSSDEFDAIETENAVNSLNAQLGLPAGQGALAVEQIKQAVISSIEIELTSKKNKKIDSISLTINVQPEDFRNILGLSSGVIVTDAGTGLEWLNWLINLGTSTVVFGFSYTPSVDGRSGGGKMDSGGTWRVPPQYAGTIDNNFITRTLNGKQREIQKILQGIFNG
ncbi:hypothetical protein OAK92_00905 [Crocinitomicaceae bacterium]|nr:hypothetical protein [Crocinitomicaceae bacterium]